MTWYMGKIWFGGIGIGALVVVWDRRIFGLGLGLCYVHFARWVCCWARALLGLLFLVSLLHLN